MIDKIKELTKDTAVYGISTIVGRFLSFLLVPFYTNVFTTNQYGILTYIYTILAFLNIVYIYGMDAAFLKFASTADENKKRDTFSTPLIFISITSFTASILFLVFRNGVSRFLNIPGNYSYLTVFLIFILLLDTLALIPFASLRLQRKAAKFAVIKIINIIINLTLNLFLILKLDMGIEAVFISNLAASAFSLIALLPEILKNLNITLDITILKRMLKFGLPYLPASIAAIIVQMIDVPIMRGLTNDSTVGIYRANYKLGIFMMLFVSMFQYAWQPFFLNNAKEKNAKEIFSKVLTLFLLAGSFIWLLITLFISDIAKIEIFNGKTIIGRQFLGGLDIVPIVLLGYLFYGLYVNFTAGIYIEEKTKYFPYVTGAGAVVNIIVNFALIPIYGIMGAAFATLASYLVMSAGLFYVSQKFYYVHFEYKKIISMIFLLVIFSITYYFLQMTGYLTLLVKFVLLLVFPLLLFLLKVINKQEISSTVKILLRKN